MVISQTKENDSIILAVSGELTALTAGQLTDAVKKTIEETNILVLDFQDLEYVASAGLRVLLLAKKSLDAKGGDFILRNVGEAVMDILEITGFSEILNLE